MIGEIATPKIYLPGDIVFEELKPFALWLPSIRRYRSIIRQLFWKGKPTNKLMLDSQAGLDPILERQVGESADDAEEDTESAGSMDLTGATINFGDYARQMNIGIRFGSLSGLAGVTIDTGNTYLEFYTPYSDTGDFVGDFYAHDTEAPGVFTTDANNISSRDRTTATCEGDGSDFGDWVGGNWYKFYGDGVNTIGDIIQELCNSYDPSAIAFLWIYTSGTGERRVRAYDYGDHTEGSKLHIEYTGVAVAGRSFGFIIG